MYWVSTPISWMPELTQLDSEKSIIRYLPPNGTAGFARHWVRSTRRLPRPSARTRNRLATLAAVGLPCTSLYSAACIPAVANNALSTLRLSLGRRFGMVEQGEDEMDAIVAAKALDLTLTSRNKGAMDSVPMCGVPVHSAEGYLERLIRKGFKVAICEQMGDPAKSKGPVAREVVRIVTPGTLTDEALLEEQVTSAQAKQGVGDLSALLNSGDTWTVES